MWGTDFNEPEYSNWYPGKPGGNGDCVFIMIGLTNNEWEYYYCDKNNGGSDIHALCEKPNDHF